MENANARWVVLKFGGTSVSSRERWETIAAIVRERQTEGLRPVVVCSAVSQVSNTLEDLIRKAVVGGHDAVLDKLETRHREHCEALGVSYDETCAELLGRLRQLAQGASLVQEVSPRLHARIMAMGELLSTRIGAAFLEQCGLRTTWVDARECLEACPEPNAAAERAWISATVSDDADPVLQKRLARLEGVLLTQGFIAHNEDGETVLLGRGGSDTSAAIFAARLQALRCEIWTDVPGMYTANPRQVPDARILRFLEYDEAQEIASTGAKVLHPRCIAPVRRHHIPLHIRCTPHPEIEGTVISADCSTTRAAVKAISARSGMTMVSMDTVGMWQQVGFLARLLACFPRHGLSVDDISTSQSNVTVTLDPAGNALNPQVLEALRRDLEQHCKPRIVGPCASVSLVGRNIRSILHKLGPALEVFEEKLIHMVTQAASDLNITFVVDESEADRLVQRLHWLFFQNVGRDTQFGGTWTETFDESLAPAVDHGRPEWWHEQREALQRIGDVHSPAWVYYEPALDDAVGELRSVGTVDEFLFSIKANNHPPVLRRFHALGLGFECVSAGELEHVLALFPDIERDRILFTPNFAPRADYEVAAQADVAMTLDSLHPLQHWPEVFRGQRLFLRVDPGRGRGHHAHVRTAGEQSKFGLSLDDIPTFAELAEKAGASVVGIHAHSGSGIESPEVWKEVALLLIRTARRHFPEADRINIGGGLSVPAKIGQRGFDLTAFDALLRSVREAHPRFRLMMEPGRFLVARAGVLLARVTQVKTKGDTTYVGVDTGMNSLIRPALYGAYHQIENLTRLAEPRSMLANIVGPICESGDTLGFARLIAPAREGDVMVIATAGAYGAVMSSFYNRRQSARELLLQANGEIIG